jgi:hypothetical protein
MFTPPDQPQLALVPIMVGLQPESRTHDGEWHRRLYRDIWDLERMRAENQSALRNATALGLVRWQRR